MKPLCIIAFVFLLAPCIADCQDIYTLSGHLIDAGRQSVSAGEIFILRESDSSVVKKTAIIRGTFVFEPVIKGEYYLKITAPGFKDKLQLLTLDETKSVEIFMEPSIAILQEVTVVGSQKTFINKNGNTFVNVENTPLAAIPDPLNLLSKLPTIQLTPDGETINIVGKGQPLIYIDNQKITMEDLKSLPVADIKTIELINNPSAKYEADGRSIILITRKINRKEGWKAELGETAAYRRYYLNRSSANMSIRKKKLELKGNFQYNQLKTWEGNSFDFQIARHKIDSRYSLTAVTTRPQFIGEAGAFYQFNEKDYVSFSTNARTQKESFPIFTNSYLKDPAHEENVATVTYNKNPNLYYTSKLNYNKKIKDGLLFIGAQQTGYNKDLTSSIFNNYNNTSIKLSQNRRQKTDIGVLAGRIDFEKTFTNEMKWETGSSATHAASHGFSNINNYNPASSLNAVFNYDEKNYAAYTQWSGKLKKMNYAAGLRMENTNVSSNYSDNGSHSAINKKSTGLFPKASLTIAVDSTKNISFKYSKTINRPDYSNANQTAVYINPYFEWANNINLHASVTDEVSATFQYQDLSLAMSFYRSIGPVYANFDFNENQSRLRRTEINYDKETGTQLTLTVPFKYKIWNSTNVMNAMLATIKDSSAKAGKSRPFVYYYSSNEFKLPGNFTFTISGWAVTKSFQGAFERNALFAVDTSLSKTLFRNLNCSVRFNNMFRSVNGQEKFTINDVAANGVFYDNSREFAVALKYSIGQLKESRYQNKDIDEHGNRVR